MIKNLKPHPRRKPKIGPTGALTPITQLKLRPIDDREWAASLATTLSRKDAIAEIKNRLGIDLKWETTYSRFLEWQEQERRLQEHLESIQQREESGDLRKSASTSECRVSYTNQFMDEAIRHNDTKTFIRAARVSIADTRVAQQIRKMDLAALRLKLDQKRMEWEIKKQKLSLPPKPKRKRKLSYEEKRKRIRQILGIDPAFVPHYTDTTKHIKARKKHQQMNTPLYPQKMILFPEFMSSKLIQFLNVEPSVKGAPDSQRALHMRFIFKQALKWGAQNSSILAPNSTTHPPGNC